MTTVLHISASGPMWWQKTASGWVTTDEPMQGFVVVVTDLAEEALVEITVPRLFGTDRSNYIQRQLLSRFPDTVFSLAQPPVGQGGLMTRLAPPTQTLTAIDPGERIETALKGLQASVAGVWSTTLLLAQLGKRPSLPADLFIVFCQPHSMRILFLKQRTPVLTRLISAAQNPSEQASEILRTLRHLENTRVIQREGQRIGLLLLGAEPSMTQDLAGERLDALPLPTQWKKWGAVNHIHVLLDLALKGTAGQLAPLSYRASYVARKWRRAIHLAAVLCVGATVWFASTHVAAIVQAQRTQSILQNEMAMVAKQVTTSQAAIATFGVPPELLRSAMTVDRDEIESAPIMQADMVRLSRIIGSIAGARLKNLQWQLLNASDSACGSAAAPAATASEPAAGQAPSRKLELQFSVVFSDDGRPRMLAEQAGELSRQLALLPGISILQDPARRMRQGAISAGDRQGQDTPDLQWCATLAGTTVANSKPMLGKL